MEQKDKNPENEYILTIESSCQHKCITSERCCNAEQKVAKECAHEFKSVNKSVRKKDAMQLLLGKPVYMDDITPRDALVVKLLRSPHANAIVEDINTDIAKKFPEL